PGRQPAEPQPPDLRDRLRAADRREAALVAVAERRRLASAEAVTDHARRVAALLHGDRRRSGEGRGRPCPSCTRAMSPSASTSGWPATLRSGPTATRPPRS